MQGGIVYFFSPMRFVPLEPILSLLHRNHTWRHLTKATQKKVLGIKSRLQLKLETYRRFIRKGNLYLACAITRNPSSCRMPNLCSIWRQQGCTSVSFALRRRFLICSEFTQELIQIYAVCFDKS